MKQIITFLLISFACVSLSYGALSLEEEQFVRDLKAEKESSAAISIKEEELNTLMEERRAAIESVKELYSTQIQAKKAEIIALQK